MTYALAIVGFGLLILGADWVIRGASAVTRSYGVSELVIGLTVVAFGTSAPEFFVSVQAAYLGNVDFALANVIGSNIANLLLVLGVAALIRPMEATSSTVWKEIPFCMLAAVLAGILANDQRIDIVKESGLTRIDGLVLLAFFLVFLYYIAENLHRTEPRTESQTPVPMAKSAAVILAGLVALWIGARWVLGGSIEFARALNVPEETVGLTAAALGTSLPELATSAMAAWRGHHNLAVGNIIGSNIFNIFGVLGTTCLVAPITLNGYEMADGIIMVGSTAILFLSMFLGRGKYTVTRWEGLLFVSMYGAYFMFVIKRS